MMIRMSRQRFAKVLLVVLAAITIIVSQTACSRSRESFGITVTPTPDFSCLVHGGECQ